MKWQSLTVALAACLVIAGCPPTEPGADSARETADAAPPAATDSPSSGGSSGPVLRDPSGETRVAAAEVVLRWNPVESATHYSVYAGTNDDPPLLINIVETSYIFSGASPCATYFWRIESHTPDGAASSPLQTFETICPTDLPDAPKYPAPANGEYGVSLSAKIVWQPSERAEAYDVYFGERSDPLFLQSTLGNRVERLPELIPGRRYYWRIVSRNEAGQSSSRVWSFVATSSPDGPLSPVLLFPPDNTPGLAARVRLDWTDVPDAVHYDVYLDTVSDSERPYARVRSSNLIVSERLDLGKTYFWRVVANNGLAETTSAAQVFSTSAVPMPPPPPLSPTPGQGSFGAGVDTRLSWMPLADADRYDVYLGVDGEPEWVATVTDPSFHPAAPLRRDAMYFWRVEASNDHGTTSSLLWRFITKGRDDDGDGGSLTSDRCPGAAQRANVAAAGGQSSGRAIFPSISANGQFVAFESAASDLVAGDTNGVSDIFVYDRAQQVTTRVSVGSDGSQGLGASRTPCISGNGRYVAFKTIASLDPDDKDCTHDIYLHDRNTGTTRWVTRAADRESHEPAISHDGRKIAFTSRATTLVANDGNNKGDVFVYDVPSNTFVRASVGSGGTEANESSGLPSISGDGRYVAFTSHATNLGGADTSRWNVYLHDLLTSVTEFVGIAGEGALTSSVSFNGRYVAFGSFSDSRSSPMQVFVRDRQTNSAALVSAALGGQPGDEVSWLPVISADGRYVAFASAADNLVDGGVGTQMNIFRRDIVSGHTALVSVGRSEQGANGICLAPVLSSDGSVIAFVSGADNLVAGDSNETSDVFVVFCD